MSFLRSRSSNPFAVHSSSQSMPDTVPNSPQESYNLYSAFAILSRFFCFFPDCTLFLSFKHYFVNVQHHQRLCVSSFCTFVLRFASLALHLPILFCLFSILFFLPLLSAQSHSSYLPFFCVVYCSQLLLIHLRIV